MPPPKKQGRPKHRLRLSPGEPAAIRVDTLAAQLPPGAWQRWAIIEGSRGPLVAAFAVVRAVAVRERLPGPEVWVVLRRQLQERPELKVYLPSAPVDTGAETLVWLTGMRWTIESAILECKSELGFDHYEVRGWTGWHHHPTMTLLVLTGRGREALDAVRAGEGERPIAVVADLFAAVPLIAALVGDARAGSLGAAQGRGEPTGDPGICAGDLA